MDFRRKNSEPLKQLFLQICQVARNEKLLSPQWDQLPTYKHDGQRNIDKSAFVYDAEKDCTWCSLGPRMPHRHTTNKRNGGQRRIRDRYIAAPQACAACPLRERCLNGKYEANGFGQRWPST